MRVHFTVLQGAALLLLAYIPAASAQTASQNKCDEETQIQAREQNGPKSWIELYHLFKDFGPCDGGSLADRFSADVAELFSEHWSDLGELNHLAANKAFEQFVLRHIDTTIDEDDLLAIANSSKVRCPAADKRICGLIHAKAQESLDNLRDMNE